MSKKTSRAASRTTARATRPAALRAAMKAGPDEERHVDGCDVDFTAGDVTADADLPPAKGGVGPARRTVPRK